MLPLTRGRVMSELEMAERRELVYQLNDLRHKYKSVL